MIGGLQGDFGDLDNKYLKQNIPKYLKMSVENIRKLQENTAALYTERKTLLVNAFRRSRYVYPEKLKCPPLPFGCEISGCKMSVYGILPRVDWAMTRKRDRLRVQGVGTPLPDDTECARLSRSTPSGFPKRKRRRNAIQRSSIQMIAYTIRICCSDGKHWLKWVSEPCYSPRSAALRWCV